MVMMQCVDWSDVECCPYYGLHTPWITARASRAVQNQKQKMGLIYDRIAHNE